MAGPALERSPGWHPDPTGRFEFRYHNGSAWTADVSNGGARFIDQLRPSDHGTGGPQRAAGRDRLAGWSMAAGIVGVAVGWMPYVVVAGVVASVVALGLALVVRRRATGTADPRAGVGLVTGAIGLAVSVAGVFLTVVVDDALDRYRQPAPHRAEVTACSTTGGLATADVAITSDVSSGGGAADFTVELLFVRSGTDNVLASARLEIDDVEPGATSTASASRRIAESSSGAPAVDCEVGEVGGPYPFGLDIGW